MKIGIDLQATKGRTTGLGVYTDNFVRTLRTLDPAHQFHFYSTQAQGNWNTARRLVWENVELYNLAKKDRVDILHVPAFAPPYRKSFKLVVTIHDLIGMIFPNQMGLPSGLYWGRWLPMAAKRADVIVVDSDSTRRDVIKYLDVSEDQIRLIYPSGHENFSTNIQAKGLEQLKRRLGIKEKYFLCVGTIEPRKNLARVIDAFVNFIQKERSTRYQLVVVGSKEFAHGMAYQALVDKAEVRFDDVIFTGYVSHEDLNRLYCGTDAFLFPSLYEGFGIPVLEAMASGVPVLTSNVSSLPEVAGDAAYYVNPNEADEITQGMEELSANGALRAKLIAAGFEQIKKFSWEKAVRETLEVYESLS
jgi:glycosyltransferase involved in cell wall biosynthesis